MSPLILAGAGHLGPSLPSFRFIFPVPTPYFGRGRPFRSVSALSFVPPSPISHPCTLSPLNLAGAGHLGPSLPSFRSIFPVPTPYSGRGRPFRSVSALSFVPPAPIFHLCTLSLLILAGAGHLGPSLPSFRPGRGRPFRSVSALSFVPPSPIFRPCTLSPLILAGRPFRSVSVPTPSSPFARGRPFRSVSGTTFLPPFLSSGRLSFFVLSWSFFLPTDRPPGQIQSDRAMFRSPWTTQPCRLGFPLVPAYRLSTSVQPFAVRIITITCEHIADGDPNSWLFSRPTVGRSPVPGLPSSSPVACPEGWSLSTFATPQPSRLCRWWMAQWSTSAFSSCFSSCFSPFSLEYL